MEMNFTNKALQHMMDFAIQFNKNSLGIIPSTPLATHTPLMPNQSIDVSLPLNTLGPVMMMGLWITCRWLWKAILMPSTSAASPTQCAFCRRWQNGAPGLPCNMEGYSQWKWILILDQGMPFKCWHSFQQIAKQQCSYYCQEKCGKAGVPTSEAHQRHFGSWLSLYPARKTQLYAVAEV